MIFPNYTRHDLNQIYNKTNLFKRICNFLQQHTDAGVHIFYAHDLLCLHKKRNISKQTCTFLQQHTTAGVHKELRKTTQQQINESFFLIRSIFARSFPFSIFNGPHVTGVGPRTNRYTGLIYECITYININGTLYIRNQYRESWCRSTAQDSRASDLCATNLLPSFLAKLISRISQYIW